MASPSTKKIQLTHQPTVWEYRGGGPEVALTDTLTRTAKQSPLLARLLYNRGIQTPEQASLFLQAPDQADTTDPMDLPDMQAAVDRIGQALKTGEAILIYGDFDVDGVTGTAILYETLKRLKANVSYYIPDRATEGHGLNPTAVCRLVSSRACKLVITTDTGISNFNEISLLKGLGVDTIVTDHHELPENLPPSVANVNPQRLEDLTHGAALMSGAGVAYQLCRLLLMEHCPEQAEGWANALLDLVAVGLVADMVPLQRDNRVLVQRGLAVLASRQRLGLKTILEAAGVAPEAPISSETIAFTIGPRLNALGRLSHATDGVELLTTDDPARAKVLAARLEQLNRKRQELCDTTFREAEQFLQQTGGVEGRKAIILASPDWNPGIIGIVASRLIEKYRLPTFLMVSVPAENKARCSARSIPGFHLTEQLEKLSHYFLNFGGHAGAAGFALPLDRLEAFKQELWQLAATVLTDDDVLPRVEVDCKLSFDQLTPGIVELIAPLAPFGMSNPAPLFVLENVRLSTQRPLGDSGQHLKLMVQDGGQSKGYGQGVEAFLWRCGPETRFDLEIPYHMVVSVEKNTFDRGTPIRLIIKDLKAAHTQQAPTQTSVSQIQASLPAATIAPKNQAPQGATGNHSDGQWLDHRQRPHLETFMAELLSGQPQKALVDGVLPCLLYNEGRTPTIPLLDSQIVRNRQNLSPAETLILWDLPPSLSALSQLLAQVRPQTIHLAGGKYATVAMRLPAPEFLKALYTALQGWMARPDQAAVPVALMASRFATTPAVLLQGLGLLRQLGLVEVVTLDGFETVLLSKGMVEPRPEDWALTPPLELTLFDREIGRVSDWRQWLMRVELATLQTLLKTDLPTTSV